MLDWLSLSRSLIECGKSAKGTRGIVRDYENDLSLFVGDDEEAARQSAERLWIVGNRAIVGRLRRAGIEDAEEIAQEVFLRIWARRKDFHPQGLYAWLRFVLTIAKHTVIDKGRSKDIEVFWPEDYDPSDREADIVETIAAALETKTIGAAANELWLGVKWDRDVKLKVIAIQAYLREDPVPRIKRLLRPYLPTIETEFNDWLADASLVRAACYLSLYRGNMPLTGYLLDPDNPLNSSEVESVLKSVQRGSARSSKNWTAEEAHVLLLRFLFGMLDEKVAQVKSDLEPEVVHQIISRGLNLLPFEARCRRLRSALSNLDQTECLHDTGLWRRLAFQYRVSDFLPHKQILERTVPAAEVAGQKISAAQLNGWLSNGRLYIQLADHLRRKGALC